MKGPKGELKAGITTALQARDDAERRAETAEMEALAATAKTTAAKLELETKMRVSDQKLEAALAEAARVKAERDAALSRASNAEMDLYEATRKVGKRERVARAWQSVRGSFLGKATPTGRKVVAAPAPAPSTMRAE